MTEEPAGPEQWKKLVAARQAAFASSILGGLGVGLGVAFYLLLVICDTPGVTCSQQPGEALWLAFQGIPALMSILGILAVAFGATGLATGRQAGPRRWRVASALGLVFGLLSLAAVCFCCMWGLLVAMDRYP